MVGVSCEIDKVESVEGVEEGFDSVLTSCPFEVGGTS
jgi:hypothetical protein